MIENRVKLNLPTISEKTNFPTNSEKKTNYRKNRVNKSLLSIEYFQVASSSSSTKDTQPSSHRLDRLDNYRVLAIFDHLSIDELLTMADTSSRFIHQSIRAAEISHSRKYCTNSIAQ